MNRHRIEIRAETLHPHGLTFRVDGELFPVRSFGLNFHIDEVTTLTLDIYSANLEIDVEANVIIGDCKISDDIARQMYEKLKEKFGG